VFFAPADRRDSGGGHVMRCLSLAGALKQRGLFCAFAVGEEGRAVLRRFGAAFASLERDALQSEAETGGAALVVFDDYAVDAAFERRLSPHVDVLAAIDDLADRPHAVDVLIDPGYGRNAQDYDGLLPQRALRLIGPSYALLRPAFAALRASSEQRPFSKPRRLFASFGLSDVDQAAHRVVSLARRAAPELLIDLALSSSAPSLAPLRALADPKIQIHLDAADVAGLMARADVGVGGGGVAAWERACVGLPSVLVALADNQRPMARRLHAAGATLVVDVADADFDALLSAALESLADPMLRRRLSKVSQDLCDGRGAERAADALIDLIARGRSTPHP
jgi:UDP-2,4-diacetamido-2,4,6-trideoxy-beta-L-altropyranose hydrolase